MKNALKLVLILSATCAAAHAQVAPAATTGAANLGYSLRYSHVAELGGGTSARQTGNVSGSARYSNGSSRLPFDLNYVGGYTRHLSGPSYSNGWFQRLALSQGVVGRKWDVVLSDDVSYLPQSPITGFSGIPGTGEPIGGSGSNPPSSASVLTLNTVIVNNVVNGNVNRPINYAITLTVGGSYDILRFPDSNGLDTDSQRANGGFTWRLNGRQSLTGQYAYSRFTYPGTGFLINTNGGQFGYKRVWNRAFNTSVSVGPEWIASSGRSQIPASTLIAADASASYDFRAGMANLTYHRGTNGGSGYMLGSKSDAIYASFTRQFEKKLTFELSSGYRRTKGFGRGGVIEGEFGGAQASWRLSRHLGLFGDYTVTTQSSSAALPPNALSHLFQVVSFGIGYTSREIHISH